MVRSSAFFTYHTVLSDNQDFTDALWWARSLADNLTLTLNRDSSDVTFSVFPYSVFYVFYEQYLTIYADAAVALAWSVLAVFVIMLVTSGEGYQFTNI